MSNLSVRKATIDDAAFIARNVMEAVGHASAEKALKTMTGICQRQDTLYSYTNTIIAMVDGVDAGSLTAYEGTNYREKRQISFSIFKEEMGDDAMDLDDMQDETCAGEYYLDSLCVLPQFRKQGVGKYLLQQGIEYAKNQGIPHVVLAVEAQNPDAERLYRSLGFRKAGELFIFNGRYHRMQLDTTPPMRIDIITVLPEMVEPFIHTSILERAQKRNLVEIHIHNLRDYTTDKHGRVDDYPYGGCAGMVMQCQPIDACISKLTSERHYDEVIFTTPDGEQFDQPMANSLSMARNLIILCGHFKGIDYRIREHLITKEVSIGDYVLTGGELAAAVMTDAIVRIIPGVIGDEQSALSDSFQDNLLAPPVYSRPADYKGWKVPDVLLSGNEKLIRNWEMDQAMERTQRLRPDLLKK